MRAVLTATSFYPAVGGAQLHWHNIGSVLASRGHEVHAVTQWTENRADWLLGTTVLAPWKRGHFYSKGVEVDRVVPTLGSRLAMLPFVAAYYALKPIALPFLARELEKQLSPLTQGADLIHNIRIGRDHLSWASFEVARRLQVPFFITPNISPRMLTRRGRFFVRTLLELVRKADGVFAFSEEEKYLLVEFGVNASKIEVIGVGPLVYGEPDPAGFARRFNIDGPLVLFLGQKLEYKGYKELAEAAPLVWRRHPRAHFLFIGPHYGRSQRILESAGRDQRIIDLPADCSTLKTTALASCDVFCLPSRQEGFGGVYTEAWHFGKPVIGCNVPFVRSVIEDGEDGLLVGQHPEQIAEAIVHLLDHPEEARQMGKRGRGKVLQKYNWDFIATQVEKFYQKALRQERRAS